MPGFDGTGPRGQGPFTGGARGYCVGYPGQGNMYRAPGRGGFARGYGRGRGFGSGAARSWVGQDISAINPVAEADALKEQARLMQEEIAAINQRIKELESASNSQDSK